MSVYYPCSSAAWTLPVVRHAWIRRSTSRTWIPHLPRPRWSWWLQGFLWGSCKMCKEERRSWCVWILELKNFIWFRKRSFNCCGIAYSPLVLKRIPRHLTSSCIFLGKKHPKNTGAHTHTHTLTKGQRPVSSFMSRCDMWNVIHCLLTNINHKVKEDGLTLVLNITTFFGAGTSEWSVPTSSQLMSSFVDSGLTSGPLPPS